MTGENSLSMDELNEFLNIWNITTPNFETVCEQSRHVMMLRKCEYEAFGKCRKAAKWSKKQTCQKATVQKLILLFQKINVFANHTHVREMTEHFFWSIVENPTNNGKKKTKTWRILSCLTPSKLYLKDCVR